jgi:hypothetical protein
MTVLQPLTTGQLLDRVFTLYRQNFLLFFLIAAVPQAVLMLMMAGGAVVAGAAPIAAVGMVVVGLLLYLGTLGLSQGATTIAAAEAFRRIAPRTLVLVGTMIGVSLLVGMGLILLIVPGIYFLVTYSLALTVVAIEKVSFSEAMSRSSDLVKGNRGRVAVIYFLSLVATYVIAFALAFPAGMAAAVLQESMPVVSAILQMAGQVVSSALATPIGLIGFTLAYYDARVRKEAFDLHLMMDSATPAQNPAATASV